MTTQVKKTSIVTLLGTHEEHGHLVFVQEGNIEMDAVVAIEDPALTLFVEAELIETGNSLAWMTDEEIRKPDVSVLLHDTESEITFSLEPAEEEDGEPTLG